MFGFLCGVCSGEDSFKQLVSTETPWSTVEEAIRSTFDLKANDIRITYSDDGIDTMICNQGGMVAKVR